MKETEIPSFVWWGVLGAVLAKATDRNLWVGAAWGIGIQMGLLLLAVIAIKSSGSKLNL